MRTTHSYTSAVRGFLNQDLYILKPLSLKQVTKASCFFFALTFSSFALFSSSQVSAEVSDTKNVASLDANGASAATNSVAIDQIKNDQKPQVVDHEFNETAAADDAIMANSAAMDNSATMDNSVSTAENATMANNDTMDAHTTSAPMEEAQRNELQPSAQDKASAVEKFNAFAADRPKRSGSLAEGGLNTTSGIIQWLLSTIAVLGIIFILAFLIKKSRFVQRSGSSIRLETQMALGPKERIVQVRVGDRHLLLGVTPSNINLILELDNDSQRESKAAKAAASKEKSESYEEDDSDYLDEELYAKTLKSSETKLASKDITKAKIKAQAARKVAARATSNLTMMPDDDVLHERASRLKQAMRHIGMDEQSNGELPSVEKTSVVFSEQATSSADKLSDAISATVDDAPELADVSELQKAEAENVEADNADAEQENVAQVDVVQDDERDCVEQLTAESASNEGNVVTSSDSVSALVKDKIAAKDETVPVADGSTGVTWVDHGHNDDAEDEQKTNDHAHGDAHSSMADADARTSKADPKGEEFAMIFAKAYAEGKERFDELTETDAGRDIMAADSDVSDDASDKKDSKEKEDL